MVSPRDRRFQAFLAAVPHPRPRPLRLLDVGGTPAYWDAGRLAALAPVEIVLLNQDAPAVDPPLTAIVGDARDLSRFPDQAFDVVFSNSTIGHVGTFADQQRMAAEMHRVGRWYYLQTPNAWCPIDWRTLVPLFHWLPPRVQAWCFYTLPVGRYRRARSWAEADAWARRIRNLTRRELRQLFPTGTIRTERVWGVAKSFVVSPRDPPVEHR